MMDFDSFVNLFEEDLVVMWKSSTHYITTDFGDFLELKYDGFLRRGSF